MGKFEYYSLKGGNCSARNSSSKRGAKLIKETFYHFANEEVWEGWMCLEVYCVNLIFIF